MVEVVIAVAVTVVAFQETNRPCLEAHLTLFLCVFVVGAFLAQS